MRYVDGYVLPVSKKNLQAYARMAKRTGQIWREHGALEVRECAGDDLTVTCGVRFLHIAKAKPGETVVLSWIAYKSRVHRDRVNTKVIKDPRILRMCDSASMPFDVKRMAYGGFKILIDV